MSYVKQDTEAEAPTLTQRVIRLASFGISATAGFVVAEALIIMGLYATFGRLEIPGDLSSSSALLGLDVLALAIGVVVSFALNERTTVKDVKTNGDGVTGSTLVRLVRFEGVSAFGNAVVILVQLALLAVFGLTPAVGSAVGAVVGFPVSYLISMRVVWRTKA